MAKTAILSGMCHSLNPRGDDPRTPLREGLMPDGKNAVLPGMSHGFILRGTTPVPPM